MAEDGKDLETPSRRERETFPQETCPAEGNTCSVKALLTSFRFLFENVPAEEGKEALLRCGGPRQKEFLSALHFFLRQLERERREKREIFLDLASPEMD
ncbi:MAG: hypothetical protein J6331_06680, partial [Lentisphaeria bacterium]|nr:hypothetical protein [Lentisphaeria bacterium]